MRMALFRFIFELEFRSRTRNLVIPSTTVWYCEKLIVRTFLIVSLIGFYFTVSLSALPALNPGTFEAGITSSAPV